MKKMVEKKVREKWGECLKRMHLLIYSLKSASKVHNFKVHNCVTNAIVFPLPDMLKCVFPFTRHVELSLIEIK